MTIIHLIPHFGHGGDWVIVKTMARAQSESGHDVRINGMRLGEALEPEGRKNNFPLNEGVRGFWKSIRNLRRIPADAGALHAHSPVCILFALLARLLRCRRATIVFTFHWPVPDHGIRRSLKGHLFRRCDRIHVLSDEVRRILCERYFVSESRIRLVLPGVSADRFPMVDGEAARESCRRRWHLESGTRVIGYLGRLATEKNVDYLIRFLNEHQATYPNLHLVIAGAGELDGQLKLQASIGPAADRIHFLGYTLEPESVYPAFDLLVLPSDFEAFALVVVEAAFCGVPALRSDAEGCRDQIEHGVTGFRYPRAGGYEAMERELHRILKHDWGRLPQIGTAAHEHCIRRCELEKFRAGLERIYQVD